MKKARDLYVPQKTINVQLPPIKTDCTCLGIDDVLSIINSPVEYCSSCNNNGYLETPVEVTLQGAVVDYMSDTQIYPGQLVQDEGFTYDNQRYVIHANLVDCTTAEYPGQNCFDLSKEVIIENENYRIISIDKSTMLGQIKVAIARTN
jgi:hypothetical protein